MEDGCSGRVERSWDRVDEGSSGVLIVLPSSTISKPILARPDSKGGLFGKMEGNCWGYF